MCDAVFAQWDTAHAPLPDDKPQRQSSRQHLWIGLFIPGLVLQALGTVLQPPVLPILLTGVLLSGIGLALYAMSKGQDWTWCGWSFLGFVGQVPALLYLAYSEKPACYLSKEEIAGQTWKSAIRESRVFLLGLLAAAAWLAYAGYDNGVANYYIGMFTIIAAPISFFLFLGSFSKLRSVQLKRAALLVACVIPVAISAWSISEQERQLGNLSAPLVAALERYKAANNGYPENLEALVPKYLPSLPECTKGSETPVMMYRKSNPEDGYWLVCKRKCLSFYSYKSKWKEWNAEGLMGSYRVRGEFPQLREKPESGTCAR